MRSAFSRTYLSTPRVGAGEGDRRAARGDAGRDRLAPLPGARERLRGERAVRTAAEAPRHGDRDARSIRATRTTSSLNAGHPCSARRSSRARRAPAETGVKVAVVDDGVDHEHPFLDPTGFSYPPGFPKGTTGSTTPKVIVARGFAGPGANSAPLDRDNSFHGTFVAGVIAGVKTDVDGRAARLLQRGERRMSSRREGRRRRRTSRVHRQLPRLQRSRPAPLGGCCSANSPEIVAAFEAAVRDGMDVINFSGGGPQADPRTDILIEAVRNVVRAGVVPIISAGNDRDFFGLGTAGSPATAPDAISVGAVANAHVFGASRPGRLAERTSAHAVRRVRHRSARPGSRRTSGSSTQVPSRVSAGSCATAAPAASLQRRHRARQPRGLPVQREGVPRAGGRRDGHRHHREPTRRPHVRVHHRALRRHDLRPRRRADPRSRSRLGRRRHGALHARHRSKCRRPGRASRRASRRRG